MPNTSTSNFSGPFIGIFLTLLGWLNYKHWPGSYKLSGKPIPDTFDLRPKLPPAFTQPDNECVGFGVAGMVAAMGKTCDPMVIEHKARVYHGNPNGGTVKPREGMWAAIDMRLASKALRVPNKRQYIMDAIANGNQTGAAVGMGFTAYDSFKAAGHTKDADGVVHGIVPMPTQGDAKAGGHFGDLVCYTQELVCFRNNASPDWGDNGHAWFPWAFVEDSHLTQDLWVLK